MKKEYGLIQEMKGMRRLNNHIAAADLQRPGYEPGLFMSMYHVVLGPICLVGVGLVAYKLLIAPNSKSLWLNIPLFVFTLFMFWLMVRWLIRLLVNLRSQMNPAYEWRPGGCHLVMTMSGETVEQGTVPLVCPHCSSQRHDFTVALHRVRASSMLYIPKFFDPLLAEKLEYNRLLRVSSVCPLTSKTFTGIFRIRQSSHNFIVSANVLKPSAG